VLEEFRRRDASMAADAYSLSHDVNLFFYHGRTRHALSMLRKADFFPCNKKRVLEIGCGARGWLPDFESWGVARSNLAGIELCEERAKHIQRLLSGYSPPSGELPIGGADIRIGDASFLPWANESFDLIVQSTVFSSLLSSVDRQNVASEMQRVLKPNGLILWYDFVYNNPRNPKVRGIGIAEASQFFPVYLQQSRLITLAPPIARAIVPYTWLTAELLQAIRILNTHRLIVFRKAS
jgi:SAM-dependent methyltransferase